MSGTPSGTACWPARWALCARSIRRTVSRSVAAIGAATSLAAGEQRGSKGMWGNDGHRPLKGRGNRLGIDRSCFVL